MAIGKTQKDIMQIVGDITFNDIKAAIDYLDKNNIAPRGETSYFMKNGENIGYSLNQIIKTINNDIKHNNVLLKTGEVDTFEVEKIFKDIEMPNEYKLIFPWNENGKEQIKNIRNLIIDYAKSLGYELNDEPENYTALKLQNRNFAEIHYPDRASKIRVDVFYDKLPETFRNKFGKKLERYPDTHNYALNGKFIVTLATKTLEQIKEIIKYSYDHSNEILNKATEKENILINNKDKNMLLENNIISKNQILYGPPGTGKTYNTAKLALEIIEPGFISDNREEILDKYNEYKKSKQIQFVTFHQSYSYEEFVEGIRLVIKDKCDTIIYEPHDGIFKKIVDLAKSEYTKAQIQENIDFSKINIYKMSLGDTSNKDEYSIYDYCIDNDRIGLGYGENVDFSSAKTKEDILKIYNENEVFKDKSSFTVDAVDRFKNWMKKGDLVLISNGNNSIRAVGLITGDYQYDNESGIRYCQFREVKWLYAGDDIPKDKFIFKNLSQMSIYQFYKQDLNIEFIQSLLNRDDKKDVKKYVLIIDEINRGNISDIFGELITLLEDTKRTDKENVEVILPYSNKLFSIPPNLYIIGTMNTADRSIALLDIALRRRFDFISKYPDSSVIGDDGAKTEIEGIDLRLFLDKINERIEVLFDRDHTIGHSYLMGINDFEDFIYKFKNRILPLLSEYFYNDFDKIAEILNQDNIEDDEWSDENTQIILKKIINDRPLYKINEKYPIEAFKKACK